MPLEFRSQIWKGAEVKCSVTSLYYVIPFKWRTLQRSSQCQYTPKYPIGWLKETFQDPKPGNVQTLAQWHAHLYLRSTLAYSPFTAAVHLGLGPVTYVTTEDLTKAHWTSRCFLYKRDRVQYLTRPSTPMTYHEAILAHEQPRPISGPLMVTALIQVKDILADKLSCKLPGWSFMRQT